MTEEAERQRLGGLGERRDVERAEACESWVATSRAPGRGSVSGGRRGQTRVGDGGFNGARSSGERKGGVGTVLILRKGPSTASQHQGLSGMAGIEGQHARGERRMAEEGGGRKRRRGGKGACMYVPADPETVCDSASTTAKTLDGRRAAVGAQEVLGTGTGSRRGTRGLLMTGVRRRRLVGRGEAKSHHDLLKHRWLGWVVVVVVVLVVAVVVAVVVVVVVGGRWTLAVEGTLTRRNMDGAGGGGRGRAGGRRPRTRKHGSRRPMKQQSFHPPRHPKHRLINRDAEQPLAWRM